MIALSVSIANIIERKIVLEPRIFYLFRALPVSNYKCMWSLTCEAAVAVSREVVVPAEEDVPEGRLANSGLTHQDKGQWLLLRLMLLLLWPLLTASHECADSQNKKHIMNFGHPGVLLSCRISFIKIKLIFLRRTFSLRESSGTD
jgi:hypothetical protein